MRLLNPWALAGLVAVAAPVVAHLLARRPARTQPFPTLRFLPASTPRPVSRERLTDLALLALRCLIVAGAAFALAQPLWVSAARARDLGRQIARAIIVDTSASMRRGPSGAPAPGSAPAGGDTSGGLGSIGPPGGRSNGSPPVTAVDRARERAAALAADATVARIVETDAPATLVAGAWAWLAAQPMRRELVVISDFQTGTIGSPDLVDLPADMGVRLEPVAAGGPIVPLARGAERGAAGTGAQAGAGPGAAGLILLAGDADRAMADAARAAAIASGAPAETGRIALLFPGDPGRSDLLRGARPVESATAFSTYERVVRDALVVEAMAREGRRAVDALSAVETTVNGSAALVLVFAAPPTPAEAAAVVRAAAIAASPAWMPDREREPGFLTDTERAALTRPTPESATGRTPDESHARWGWMGILALLLTELLVRRRRRPAAIEEAPRARVA